MPNLTDRQRAYGADDIPDARELVEYAREFAPTCPRQRARKIFSDCGITDDPWTLPVTDPSPF